MEVERVDGDPETKVLLGMILSNGVLAHIAPKYKEGMFSNPWAGLLGYWCVNYFEEYGIAPGFEIKTIFNNWRTRAANSELAKSIERVLLHLSDEASHLEELNTQFIIDQANQLFTKNSITALLEQTYSALQDNRIRDAQQTLDEYQKVDLGQSYGINVLSDPQAFQTAAEAKARQPLITLPGAVGEFIGDAFDRDNFVAFLSKDKMGKSAQLLDLAWRAVLQRRRVAYFECGDMTQEQVLRRLMCRVMQRPWKAGTIKYPCGITHDFSDDHCHVPTREIHYPEPMDWQKAWSVLEGYRKKLTKEWEPFKLACYPSGSFTVADMESVIEHWRRVDGFSPDVVLVDYVDLLKSIGKKTDERMAINEAWIGLRGLAQKYHALVLTATQSDTDSYDAYTLTRTNFSGDKRKNAHATGIIGINGTCSELEQGIRRWNWLVLRDAYFNESKCVYLAGNMAIMNPLIHSCW